MTKNFNERLNLGDISHELTAEERKLACAIINVYGSGGHPVADERTLDFFTAAYVVELIETSPEELTTTTLDLAITLRRAIKDIEDAEDAADGEEGDLPSRSSHIALEIDAEEMERRRIVFRRTLKPYDIVKTKDGHRVEIMSFPFNEEDSPVFVVFARRRVGDATSAEYIRVDELDVATR